MAAIVGKYAANQLLKKQMGKYANKKVDGGDVCHLKIANAFPRL
jgi:hypothetical protein